MDQSKQLFNLDEIAIKQRADRNRNRARRLGDVLNELMGSNISPRQARFACVDELWSQLLPPELEQHCRLADITSGQLKVLVDSPSHLHELQLCGLELLAELQRQCPQARIKKIKFTIG